MNLHFKLIFPLVAGYLLFASVLHYLWVPLLLSDAHKNYQKNVQLILASIEPEIIRGLISSDIAALNTFLESQMTLHLDDWKWLEIIDSNDVLIFPFEKSVLKNSQGNSSNIIETRLDLEYLGNKLGTLWLVVDWGAEKNTILQRFRQIELYLLVVFGFIVIVSLIWQNLKITKPIKKLTSSVSQLADGDYNVIFPDLGRDEIGQLADAFKNMLQQRQLYEAELETLSRQTQQALNELTEQKFALDQHAIVTVTDVQGTITYANEKISQISGYTNEELLNNNHRLLNSGTHSKAFFSNLYKTISSGKIWHGEICNKAKDGHLYWVETTIAPIMGENKKPQSYIAIRTDISNQKKTERDLLNAKNLAEDATRVKSEFLASMSHEIRTPMNGVLGMLSLLQNTDLTKEQQHRLMLAKNSAQSLLTLINDILDFSKVDAGKMRLESLDFNLRSMLGELVEMMMHQMKEKNIELILDTVGIEQTMVKGDPGRLRQILTNIIGNAIKFTEQGEIVVEVSLHSLNENEWQFNCQIRDTGIGIPADKLSLLFDSFSQVDSSTTRVYGGTGLGLAIVQKLCVLMNGNITVSSVLDEGSCFNVSLRISKSNISQQVLPSVDMGLLNLLIIDDNSTNREVLRCQLEHWGATVAEAESGAQAIDLCEQQVVKEDQVFFDIAFLDMQMPEMDGATLGKFLKADSRFAAMKLIMMTSMGIIGDAKYFSELGFSGYFPKPTTTTDLFEALSVVAENGAALQQAEPLVTSHYLKTLKHEEKNSGENKLPNWPQNLRLLLVEDIMVNQLVANGILNEFGLHADVAENGLRALQCLQEAPLESPYSMVLMDCQMPEMDGYEASRQIRNGKGGERYKDIPIIAMTANAMQGDREKCLQAGMSDYLSKPIEPHQLLNKLQQWLVTNDSIVNRNRHENKSIAMNSDSTITTSSVTEVTVWDQQATLNRLFGKEDLLKQLLELFIEENPERLCSLTLAIEDNDNKQVLLIAHTIKGVAANLSGVHLQQHAYEMEKAAKLEDMQRVKILMPELLQISEQLESCFKEYISQSNIA